MIELNEGNILRDIKNKPEIYWSKIKEKEILNLFHSAAIKVPAYKDFLNKNKINHNKISTLQDFGLVPPISKDSYLKAYPYKDLFWNGTTKNTFTLHSTSGSTGEATYFQRNFASDFRRQVIIESFFRSNPLTITEPTLFVITFGMGIWSAGMGIYTAAYLASNKNKIPISIISPGINKIETLKILKKLAPNYKQVILVGYPPFIKDIVDEALENHINIRRINLRFVFTGEAFTEEFRDYLMDRTKVDNLFLDTMNTYGTSEFGATAIETPLAILARRLAYKNKAIFKDLFGNITKTPTIAQYIPYFVNFQSHNGELFVTGDNPMPLVKYQSGDNGGVLSFEQLKHNLLSNGFDLSKEAKRLNISKYIYKIPLVYVYERKNLAASLYGILIYPEFVKSALFDRRLTNFVTGKFTMRTRYSNKQNQYLEINIELKRGKKNKKHFEQICNKIILKKLREKSSEFRELSDNLKARANPKLLFWPYEYPEFFTADNKQKWVKK